MSRAFAERSDFTFAGSSLKGSPCRLRPTARRIALRTASYLALSMRGIVRIVVQVRIDQRAGEWAEIVLEDGKVGWVPLETFGVI